MTYVHVEASATIAAPASRIYSTIADYKELHPRIVPRSFLSSIRILQGGNGEGTVFEATTSILAGRQVFQMEVSEPQPGRVIAEQHLSRDLLTTFTVDPLDGGESSMVTIATVFAVTPGISGFIERVMTPPMLRSIYRQELANLSQLMQELQITPQGATSV